MNIPENILQAVADAAFENAQITWGHASPARRAVIQHALSNPSLAPFLSGGIGEYMDEELRSAWSAAEETNNLGIRWLRAFIDALPRRESPALAEAIARAEKAEAELAVSREINQGLTKSCLEWEKIVQELKSSQLGILRPIAEMSPPVPDGYTMVFGSSDSNGVWDISDILSSAVDTHFAILRLPAAEATPPAKPEPTTQVPLGPEDCPPGSVFRSNDQPDISFWTVSQVWERGFYLRGECVDWRLAMERMEINTSLPDTGRWDEDAWRPCIKPGKEVAK